MHFYRCEQKRIIFMDKFMLSAIEEAKKSSEPLKCGAVITKDGKIISEAHNTQRASKDASAHAEINAIRKAGQVIGQKNLDGCIIYCTCEPCTMCLSAIIFSKIKKIVYGVSLAEAFPDSGFVKIDIDYFLSKSPAKINVVKNFMIEECRKLI